MIAARPLPLANRASHWASPGCGAPDVSVHPRSGSAIASLYQAHSSPAESAVVRDDKLTRPLDALLGVHDSPEKSESGRGDVNASAGWSGTLMGTALPMVTPCHDPAVWQSEHVFCPNATAMDGGAAAA
jgi:hypothetical protein